MVELTYDEFIQNILNTRGRFSCGDEYHERHHIVPKCLGGTNEEKNLIDLFAREHFIAHKLLAQENPENAKLIYAYSCMAFLKNNYEQRYELTPEEYEDARKKLSEARKGIVFSDETKRKMRENHADVSGENNPNYGKPRSDEVKRKLREAHLGMVSPLREIPRTEEVKQKISASLKGRYVGENNPNYGNHKLLGENSPSYGSGLAVVQFNKNGDRMFEYVSSIQAERKTGIAQANIRQCCKGKIASAGSFMWRFAKDCSEEKINPYVNPKYKPIVQLDLNNNLIQSYDSIKMAANYTNIPSSNIIQCCKGITKTCGGFRWMYKEKYEKQLQNLNEVEKEK